jgi:hypothetical protein
MLLSVDEPADALLSFLSRRANLISRAMFEVPLTPSFPPSLRPALTASLRSSVTTLPALSITPLVSSNLCSVSSPLKSMRDSPQMVLLRKELRVS